MNMKIFVGMAQSILEKIPLQEYALKMEKVNHGDDYALKPFLVYFQNMVAVTSNFLCHTCKIQLSKTLGDTKVRRR